MLHIVDTRFASHVVMLRRFKKIASFLKLMVVGDEWVAYRKDDEAKARTVKDKVLDDSFWDEIDFILNFTKPIYNLIRAFDKDRPSLHLVYPMWITAMSKIKKSIYTHEKKKEDEESLLWDAVHGVLEMRKKQCTTPLHAIAHSLNPKYEMSFFSYLWFL